MKYWKNNEIVHVRREEAVKVVEAVIERQRCVGG